MENNLELTRIIHKVLKRREVVGKVKVKYQVKRIFIRCMRYFSFSQGMPLANATHDQISMLLSVPKFELYVQITSQIEINTLSIIFL